MSERDEELELQALQRQLDDAFETTRPRTGFEDELWVRMQARRPLWGRIRDAFAGFTQGVREAPAVPAAAVAAVLVVVIGASVISLGGLGFGTAGEKSAMTGDLSPQAGGPAGAFGPVPPPVFSQDRSVQFVPGTQTSQGAAATPYTGSATMTWAGQFNLTITSAPVFRYQEPTSNAADNFASSLGATLQGRPDGFLGSYATSDYTLRVRGTVQVPPVAPAYFILSEPNMPAISASGASPGDIAALFLAEHNLLPQWPYTVSVEGTGYQLKVKFFRQFAAPGYGLAYLVDTKGMPYGLEVDLNGTQAALASGPLPVSLESADYRIITFDQAVRAALASPQPAIGSTPLPSVQLTKAELVYALVAAGDHSFYEPAFLFSGTFQVNGVSYEKRVVVPAVATA